VNGNPQRETGFHQVLADQFSDLVVPYRGYGVLDTVMLKLLQCPSLSKDWQTEEVPGPAIVDEADEVVVPLLLHDVCDNLAVTSGTIQH